MIRNHIHIAFNKLGLPDKENSVAGLKFYLWGTRNHSAYTH